MSETIKRRRPSATLPLHYAFLRLPPRQRFRWMLAAIDRMGPTSWRSWSTTRLSGQRLAAAGHGKLGSRRNWRRKTGASCRCGRRHDRR